MLSRHYCLILEQEWETEKETKFQTIFFMNRCFDFACKDPEVINLHRQSSLIAGLWGSLRCEKSWTLRKATYGLSHPPPTLSWSLALHSLQRPRSRFLSFHGRDEARLATWEGWTPWELYKDSEHDCPSVETLWEKPWDLHSYCMDGCGLMTPHCLVCRAAVCFTPRVAIHTHVRLCTTTQ